MKKHFVGIDLGTTNCALAFVPPNSAHGIPKPFGVVQLSQPDQVEELPLLPSFGYLPAEGEFSPGTGMLPWGLSKEPWVGYCARNLGGRIPGRMIHSAKSWLAHPKADPTTPLLPWQAPPGQRRISPVDAAAAYLEHLCLSWESSHLGEKLADQHVVLTIPASFDDQARRHTINAAKKAGLNKATLLEEPLAAFYHFLAEHTEEAASFAPGMTVLVVDVGGGTTDFTLIEATSVDGELAWSRRAVGEHLLLGGDNMDHALAHFAETLLNTRLDGQQLSQLIQACRSAKEVLFSNPDKSNTTVTVTGRGSSLMGSTLTTKISQTDLDQVLLNGFLPICSLTDLPTTTAKTGLVEAGLPFARDPAITRHLAAFLANHLGEIGPDALLFNGGVFHAPALRNRIVEVLSHWYPRAAESVPLRVFAPQSLDLAVARGAAHFAWLKATGGKRVQGGSARSYYVALAAKNTNSPENTKNTNSAETTPNEKQSLLCVLPRQAEEGLLVVIEQPELELTLGEPVRFSLLSSTTRPKDQPGNLLMAQRGEMHSQGDLQTRFRAGKSSLAKTVKVRLTALPTEIGTLELGLLGQETGQSWKLEFNMRPLQDPSTPVPEITPFDTITEAQIAPAMALLAEALAGLEPSKGLVKALEGSLGQNRQLWPVTVCRRLWEALLQGAEGRKSGQEMSDQWSLLTGWCLRPGFGMPGDEFRMETLWKLLYGPQAGRSREGGSSWWVAWRRVSGGLDEARQQSLMDRLRAVLLPIKGRSIVKPPIAELAEMWRLAASLERLDIPTKAALAEPLLRMIRRPEAPDYAYWALARLGNRVPLHGPVNNLLSAQSLTPWVALLEGSITVNPTKKGPWLLLCTELVRPTGDRHLDLPEKELSVIEGLLHAQGQRESFHQARQKSPEQDLNRQASLLGDALPLGIRLSDQFS